MRRKFALGTLLCLGVISFTKLSVNGETLDNKVVMAEHQIEDTVTISPVDEKLEEIAETISQNIRNVVEIHKENERDRKVKEAQEKLESLDRNDELNWFIKYKKLQEEYAEWIDPDETIYDYYTDDELEFLFRIVEAEVTSETEEPETFIPKANVACVIFNRIESENFPDSLTDVLSQSRQFETFSNKRYKKIKVTELTILATEFAFMFGDLTDGALFFDSCGGNGKSWADRNMEFIFVDEVGHRFYR